MKTAIPLMVVLGFFAGLPVHAQAVVEGGAPTPAVTLPSGPLPVGEATNLVFIAPLVGGLLGLAALGGGGSPNSTTSTSSTTN